MHLDAQGERAALIVDVTRALVAVAHPKHPDQAQIACGYVARYLAWATVDGATPTAELVSIDKVDRYVDQLDTTLGSRNSARSYLRRCATDGPGLQRQPATTSGVPHLAPAVADKIATYRPATARVSAALWATTSERVRLAVAVARPTTAEQANRYLTVTALYVAWAGDADLFEPAHVEEFITTGTGVWTKRTAQTYASNLRTIARNNEPALWATQARAPKANARIPYSPGELASIARSIEALTPRRRRHTEALFLLGSGAGIVGTEAGMVRPGDVEDRSVKVTGSRPRVVPVRSAVGRRLVELAAEAEAAGDTFLVGGTTKRDERQAVLWGGLAPHGTVVSPTRLRFTWLVSTVELAMPFAALLTIAGLTSGELAVQAARCARPYDATAVAATIEAS